MRFALTVMEEPLNSLDGWVAFKPNAFADEAYSSVPPAATKKKIGHQFLVAWNHSEAKLAVTFIEGHRKVSDKRSKSHACCLR